MWAPINTARRWMSEAITSPEAPDNSASDTTASEDLTAFNTSPAAPGSSESATTVEEYMIAYINEYGALAFSASTSPTSNYITVSIDSLEALESADCATTVDQKGNILGMPAEILKMIIEQTIAPEDEYDEYDLTCRLVNKRFAGIGEEVMGSLHRRNKRCRLPSTLKYDRSTESRAIMAAVSSTPRFAALITEVACGTLSELDDAEFQSLETALSHLKTNLETVLSRLPNLTELSCNRRNTSDDDDDDEDGWVVREDLYWGSLCDIAHAAHNLSKMKRRLKIDTIVIRVGPSLHLADNRSQLDLHSLFHDIKHLRIDFVRDRTARVKAHKRSSRNHLWDRNQPTSWPAYYQPESDEALSWGALLASTMDNLESLTFAGHDTFGCVERRIEDVITAIRWKKLTRFTIEIGEARQDWLIGFLEAHETLTYVDLRYLKLYEVEDVWDGLPRMRQLRVQMASGELRILQETQEDRDRGAARRQASRDYDEELDFLEKDDEYYVGEAEDARRARRANDSQSDDLEVDDASADDELEDEDEDENDDVHAAETEGQRAILGTPMPRPRRSVAPSPPPPTQQQSEQSEQDQPLYLESSDDAESTTSPTTRRARAWHRTVFAYDSQDSYASSADDLDDLDDDDSDSDAEAAREDAFIDRDPDYTSLDTVVQGDMMELVRALARLKRTRPALKTVRHIVRAGWVHQSDELLAHWQRCWKGRDVPEIGFWTDFEEFREHLWEASRSEYGELASWDIGPVTPES